MTGLALLLGVGAKAVFSYRVELRVGLQSISPFFGLLGFKKPKLLY